MPRKLLTAVTTLVLFAPAAVRAQSTPDLQFSLGFAFRDAALSDLDGTHGVELGGRLAVPMNRHLSWVGEVGLTSFPTRAFAVPRQGPCGPPGTGTCSLQPVTSPGPQVAGLALGLQPRFSAGAVDILVAGTAGGYWAFRRSAGVPSTMLGLGARLALLGPGSHRVRPMLQGSTTRLIHRGNGAKWLGSVGLGLQIQ